MQDPDARDRDGDPVVVAIGAHYRSQALTKEDLLLHVVNVSSTSAHCALPPSLQLPHAHGRVLACATSHHSAAWEQVRGVADVSQLTSGRKCAAGQA